MQSRFVKIIAVVAAAASVGGGGAAAALVLTDEQDASPLTASRTADAADRALEAVVARVAGAKDLASLRSAADAAGQEANAVRERMDGLAAIETRRYRDAARTVLLADAAALDLLAQLAPADGRGTAAARRLAGGAARAQAELDRAAAQWPAPEDASRRAPPRRAPQILLAAESAAGELRRIDRSLARWRARVARARRERKAELAVLGAYATSFRSYQASYQKLRDETETFIAEVDDDGATFSEAYEFLEGAISGRSGVRRGLAALDSPKALAAEHTTVLAALDKAIDAMNAAYRGIVDYQFDRESYDSYKDTPGWEEFAEKSDSLAGEYATAMAGWEQELAAERRTISSRSLPKEPEV